LYDDTIGKRLLPGAKSIAVYVRNITQLMHENADTAFMGKVGYQITITTIISCAT